MWVPAVRRFVSITDHIPINHNESPRDYYFLGDFVPSFLSQGQLITGPSKAWLGGLGEIGKPYSHPSTKQCNAAAGSHTHAASNITSGTLGTTRGGTGITANPSMLVNLGSTNAASVFATSPRPGVTGTLPVANGGTGVTSIDALKMLWVLATTR